MPEPEPQPEFSWRTHPARERLAAAVGGLLVVVAFAALAGILMQSVWWSLFAVIVMGLTLNRFFLPTQFSIDAEGITARYPLVSRRALWVDLARFIHDERGGRLSGASRRRWRAGGLHILFGANREPVLDVIRRHLPEGGVAWAR